jgi:putative component of membrane protein insertase Oxa1/YidC/SpoIIIJ protein YidD
MRHLLVHHPHSHRYLRSKYCALGLGGARRQGAGNGQCRPMDDSRDVYQRDRSPHIRLCKASGQRSPMSELRQQSSAGEREMSTLRRSVKRPEPYLAVLALMLVCGILDSFRAPEDQLCARVYIGAVRRYQLTVRTHLSPYIQCRYQPTCSVYSAEAVRKWGIQRGLLLTWRRLVSCRRTVALGTLDPVPIPTVAFRSASTD